MGLGKVKLKIDFILKLASGSRTLCISVFTVVNSAVPNGFKLIAPQRKVNSYMKEKLLETKVKSKANLVKGKSGKPC